jgi:hypothetical protein
VGGDEKVLVEHPAGGGVREAASGAGERDAWAHSVGTLDVVGGHAVKRVPSSTARSGTRGLPPLGGSARQ